MALEDLTGSNKFIDALVPANPANADDVREGAAHIRGVKNVLVNSFPNVNGQVLASDEQLNNVAVLGTTVTFDNVYTDLDGSVIRAANTGGVQYSELGWNTDALARLSVYWQGVAQWGIGFDASGNLAAFSGNNAVNWKWRVLLSGLMQIVNQVQTINKTSRTDSGFIDGSSRDLGKAPGIARGIVTTDANGQATFTYGITIANPVIQVTPTTTLANPCTAGILSAGNSSAVVQVHYWNGSTLLPAAGYNVHVVAMDQTLTSS